LILQAIVLGVEVFAALLRRRRVALVVPQLGEPFRDRRPFRDGI
jgi:hypothetical protein